MSTYILQDQRKASINSLLQVNRRSKLARGSVVFTGLAVACISTNQQFTIICARMLGQRLPQVCVCGGGRGYIASSLHPLPFLPSCLHPCVYEVPYISQVNPLFAPEKYAVSDVWIYCPKKTCELISRFVLRLQADF